MTDETNTTPDEPETPAGNGFQDLPWVVLLGLRQRKPGEAAAGTLVLPQGLAYGMSADPTVYLPTPQGPQPDKTVPAVHFGLWLDRNLPYLIAMWEQQYVQYMNLRMRSQPVGRPPELALVDTRGERLSTDVTQ